MGPSAVEADAEGNLHLLDSVNGRIQVFSPEGLLLDVVELWAGQTDDLELSGDGSYYVLDRLPGGTSRDPIIKRVVPSDSAFSPPSSVTEFASPMAEPVKLLEADGRMWVYGTPEDAFLPLVSTDTELQMAAPVEGPDVLRRIEQGRLVLVDLAREPLTRTVITPPRDRLFGEIALLERWGSYIVVIVRTWSEAPPWDQHEVLILDDRGQLQGHAAVANGEFAQSGSLSMFEIGLDGRLYQLFSSPAGFEIRGFDLEGFFEGGGT
jgi:hypothetical protein